MAEAFPPQVTDYLFLLFYEAVKRFIYISRPIASERGTGSWQPRQYMFGCLVVWLSGRLTIAAGDIPRSV